MRILVAVGDPRIAAVLRQYLGDGHDAVAFVDDLPEALKVAEKECPDLALVGMTLADHSTGYFVASELKARNVPSAFVCPSRLPFAMPELAMGWLRAPFTEKELASFLDMIASTLSASKPSVHTISPNFQIYEPVLSEAVSLH